MAAQTKIRYCFILDLSVFSVLSFTSSSDQFRTKPTETPSALFSSSVTLLLNAATHAIQLPYSFSACTLPSGPSSGVIIRRFQFHGQVVSSRLYSHAFTSECWLHTQEREEVLGERNGDLMFRVSRRNSTRQYYHASDWTNARRGCGLVYLSWTVYVIMYGIFLLVRRVGDVLRERGYQDFHRVVYKDDH